MNLKDAALRVAVLSALLDQVKEAKDTARAQFKELADTAGADAATAALGEAEIARVAIAGGKTKVVVTDEAALLAYVSAAYPSEVETRVREAFRSRLLDTCKGFDPNTGERLPGVSDAEGAPYVSCRFKPDGRTVVAQAWARGELDTATLLALEASADA